MSVHKDSGFVDGIFNRLPDWLDGCFGIPQQLLRSPGNLFMQTFCLLLLVANNGPGLLLNLARDVLYGALDLIFVHDDFSQNIF
jgi:hypothetical protein